MKIIFPLCLVTLLAVPSPLLAHASHHKTSVGTTTFSGIVEHVSVNNIKVMNPKSKKALAFLIVPKFKRVFSSNGKTTYQMSSIKPGQYVTIYYDQKALGVRHADRIVLGP